MTPAVSLLLLLGADDDDDEGYCGIFESDRPELDIVRIHPRVVLDRVDP